MTAPNADHMSPDQKKCEEEVGHDWQRFAYEHDTGAGGYMECKLCGHQVPDDGDDDYFDPAEHFDQEERRG